MKQGRTWSRGRGKFSQWIIAIMSAVFPIAGHSALSEVELKSRTIPFSPHTTAKFIDALKMIPGEALHGLVMFSRHPTLEDRRALDQIGVSLLGSVQPTAYRVRVAKSVDMSALASAHLKPNFTQLVAEDRVEPRLLKGKPTKCICAPQPSGGCICELDGTVDIVVRMHKGVADIAAIELFEKYYAPQMVVSEKLSDDTWILSGFPRRSLLGLAGEDAALWINAMPSIFEETNDARVTTKVENLQGFRWGRPWGLGGRDVRIGLFDRGLDENHGDFVGRVIRNDAGVDKHATHMAGIIAGSGVMSTESDSCGRSNWTLETSAFQWRGMAPLAQLIDIHVMPPFGRNGINTATHLHYITKYGMDISNHSYGFNRDRTYDNSNATRDEIIRGDATSNNIIVPPRLHVTSAGNSNKGYFTLSKQLKNALVVGAWGTSNELAFGSLGPTQDGRIKPDVTAPGVNVTSSGFCSDTPEVCSERVGKLKLGPLCQQTGGHIQRQGYYSWAAGTSGASAVTTGVLALVLEQYNITNRVDLGPRSPLPSTLRGLMIHTADDKQSAKEGAPPTPGPDFVTGWGFINAENAVRMVAEKRFREEDVLTNTCDQLKYSFQVGRDAKASVRVTLAWDDATADPALPDEAPKLVNDLDLVLIDPNGKHHYPWQLNQSILDMEGKVMANEDQECGTPIRVQRLFLPNNAMDSTPPPAIHGGRDHLNNVEVVDAPVLEGTWYAIVSGYAISQGPQPFSLIGELFLGVLPGRAE